MKYFTLALCCLALLLSNLVFAQNQAIQFTGKVIDSQSQQPIEFATIMVADVRSKTAITGGSTDLDGNFELNAPTSEVYLEISFIGFDKQTITDFTVDKGKVNLGTIQLSENSKTLDEVVVRAEKSQTEFKLDKRVFNVGKDLSSAGGSAFDVLNNVPSVNVSIEGEISLRGSNGVQVLINGKPSVLTSEQGNALGTITADMIEKIEVITNPSAKYDAEGTSGIINIVIKKEERKGLNGSVSINTGVPHNHSIGLSLNRRTEKFNLFSQIGVGYRELPNDVESNNLDSLDLFSVGEQFRNENFYNLILGTDYHINERNVLTLSGYFAYEIEDQPSETEFSLLDDTGNLVSDWIREETTEATNPKFQYELQYKRDFKDNEDHVLLFSALGNFFGKDQSSVFQNTTLSGENRDRTQETRTNFGEAIYTFKLDYSKPFSEKVTMETGAQYVFNDVSNDFEVLDFVDGEWIADPDFTNVFEYDQKVLGVYATGAYEGEKIGVKAGLRVENTALNTFLINTNEANNQNYTNLFPSFHTSYKLNDQFSLQAGYSRRIFRPRLWDLNPFFNIRNEFNIRTGNPDLLPELTDSYEIASIYIIGQTSLNFSIYHRYTTDVIERIPIIEGNVTTTTPFNLGTNRSTGAELNFKFSPKKWITFNGDINYNYFDRKGSTDEFTFDFSADRWTSKLNTKFKLPADFDFELTGQYQSAFYTVRNDDFSIETQDNIFLDLGLRKKLMKGKGVISFSVRDVFASRVRESETLFANSDNSIYSRRQRGRFITLGFSYGFGKGEAMEFSGSRRR